jgi:hypothetical protein
MINYSGIDVKSMTEDQMKSLIGMKFSENPPKAPDSNVREEAQKEKDSFIYNDSLIYIVV